MTLEEFQALWQSGAKTEPKSQPKKAGGGRWEVGEWRAIDMADGTRLLKKLKNYWDPESGAQIKEYITPERPSGFRGVPVFERWFLKWQGDVKWLCNCNRMRHAPKGDEGSAGDALYDVTQLDEHQIESLIDDGSYYNWKQYSLKPPKTYIYRERLTSGYYDDWNLVDKYRDCPVIQIMYEQKKSRCWVEIWAKRDGGYIDEFDFLRANK